MAQLSEAVPVLDMLTAAGHDVYIVGGAVRNYLLGQPIHDIDITTSALPEEVEQLFPRTIPVGREHGTIIVLHKKQHFEVTTFRTDGKYQDHRRPDQVIFVDNLKEDLIRRDFTINALAMTKTFEIIDYVDGRQDIRSQLIRAVGEPDRRFQEDALRMMRAARFQSVLNFDIEDATYKAICEHHQLIRYIAIERITAELSKLLAGQRPDKGLTTIKTAGLNDELPMMKQMAFPTGPVTLAAYFGYISYLSDDSELKQLKLSNKQTKAVKDSTHIYQQLLSEVSSEQLLVYRYGAHLINDCINLLSTLSLDHKFNGQPEVISSELPIHSPKDIAVDGEILMQHFNKPGGPWIRLILSDLEQLIVTGELVNERNNLLKWVEVNVEI